MNKTKEYKLRANRNHHEKLFKKQISINIETEKDLLHAIQNDNNQSFNSLVKDLLKSHYKL